MHPSQQTIEKLYSAFARLDADSMAQCYAADASFDDEAFSLHGHPQVSGMWHMLCDATQAKGAMCGNSRTAASAPMRAPARAIGRPITASVPPAAWCTT